MKVILMPICLLGLVALALTACSSEPQSGDVRVDSHGIEQVWVPAGSFMMGSDDPTAFDPPDWARREAESEQPQHELEISSGFWIDRYEVTNAAFQAFVDDGGYENEAYWSEDGWDWLTRRAPDELPVECAEPVADHPRVCVTWYEAQAYARWRDGRLPTEAEWEYAARGPESRVYPWGDQWDAARANVVDSPGLVAVGSYPGGVSWVEAHDMSGNAMEWVQDWWSRDYYEQSPRVDPTGPESGYVKVEKGGWWGSNPYVARPAYRHFEDPPDYQDHHIGFRIVTPAGVEDW